MKAILALLTALTLLGSQTTSAQPREPLQRPSLPIQRPLPSPYPAPVTFDELLALQLLQQPAITFPTQTTCWGASGVTFCETK